MMKVRSVNPARIYQGRLAAGMTQDDLAHKIRVLSHGEIRTTASGVSRWENGTNSPSAEAVPVIAAAEGVSIDYLYGSDEDEEESLAVDPSEALLEVARGLALVARSFRRDGVAA